METINKLIYLFFIYNLITKTINATDNTAPKNDNTIELPVAEAAQLLTPINYVKLFKIQRNDMHFMVKQMLKWNYERNYELLKLAYDKVFEILTTNNITLNEHDYVPSVAGFPQTVASLQKSVTVILENCCLAAECILHFPEISYRVLNSKKDAPHWLTTLNWCSEFVLQLPHIIDESTVKLMQLLKLEINADLRDEDYVNPYYAKTQEEKEQSNTNTKEKQQRKHKKKLKKGPQLSGGGSTADTHNEL